MYPPTSISVYTFMIITVGIEGHFTCCLCLFIASVSTGSTTTEEPVDTKSKSPYKREVALWAAIAHSWPDLVAAWNLGLNKDRASEGRVSKRERERERERGRKR